MSRGDFVHTAIPKELFETVKKVLIDCERLNIFLNKKLAYLIINEKAKRGWISASEIKKFIRKQREIAK